MTRVPFQIELLDDVVLPRSTATAWQRGTNS